MALGGCGGGRGEDQPAAPSGQATLGIDGGRIATAAAEVLVPPGALDTMATVRIAADSTGAPPLPGWARPAGDMMQITPHGSTFSAHVTVRLRAPAVALAANEQLLIAKAQPGGSWEVLSETALVDGRLEVQVRSFSYFMPVVISFVPTTTANFLPFMLSPPTFLCNGAACPSIVVAGESTVVASSSGNGGQLPSGCVNPEVLLNHSGSGGTQIARVPAAPSMLLQATVPLTQLPIYFDGAETFLTQLRCRDASTDAISLLRLSSASLDVGNFSTTPRPPQVRRFPTALTAAPGESLTARAILTAGGSFRTSGSTFEAPTVGRRAEVHLERLVPGDASWRIERTRLQTEADPRPTGGAAWAYWGLDFPLGPFTVADNGTRYRLRACLPNLPGANCTIGPVTVLTVVQQVTLPSFAAQPAPVLVQPGQTASFDAQVIGVPSPTLQWQTRAAGAASWENVAGGAGATSTTYTTAPVGLQDNGRQFRLVATNVAGSTISGVATLSMSAESVAPTIVSQPAPLTVLAGSEAVFAVAAQGTAALSYQWLRDGMAIPGANGTQLKLPAVSVSAAAVYAVRVSNTAGTATSNGVQLTVSSLPTAESVLPTIVTPPTPVSVTAGSGATFGVGVTGGAPLSFQWRKDGVDISGATAATYHLPVVASPDNGAYSVRVSNPLGSVVSNAVALSVAAAPPLPPAPQAPTIVTQPGGAVVAPGMGTTLAITVAGSGPFTYTWVRNGAVVPGQTSAAYTIAAASSFDAGTYVVQVSNSAGTVSSSPTQVVLLGAPAITVQPVAAAVTVGGAATFGVTASGDQLLYQWTRNNVAIPGASGASYTTPTLALVDSGTVYGVVVYNGAGLVMSATVQLTVTAAPVASVTAEGKVALGLRHSCALTPDLRVLCWGYNGGGHLGNGSYTRSATAVVWNLPEPVASISAGQHQTCALTATTGRVFCAGDANQAVVPTEIAGFTGVRQVAAGTSHACLLASDRTVWCWGSNNAYQLGDGTGGGSFLPVQVRDGDPNVPLENVVELRAGANFNCVRLADGAVGCWGQNNNGQLGGTLDGRYPNRIAGLSDVTQIAPGAAHVCVLQANATVRCWGDNANGALGLGFVSPVSQPIVAPTEAIGAAGAVALAAGSRHTCALMADATVRCWGNAAMGNGSPSEVQSTPFPVGGLTNAIALDAGFDHTCVLRNNAELRCWGENAEFQIGTGDMVYRTTPVIAFSSAMFWSPP